MMSRRDSLSTSQSFRMRSTCPLTVSHLPTFPSRLLPTNSSIHPSIHHPSIILFSECLRIYTTLHLLLEDVLEESTFVKEERKTKTKRPTLAQHLLSSLLQCHSSIRFFVTRL